MKKMDMFKKLLIERDDAIAVAIDFQEKLLPAMKNPGELEDTVIKLTSGLKALNIPILVTQQYTRGLGETVPSIADAIGEFTPIEKFTFSAWETEEFVTKMEEYDQNTVILFGIESHICVLQTTMDLLKEGYNVFVVADACMSRSDINYNVSLKRMADAGAFITTYESVLYELLGSAKADGFKEVAKIVK
ncbi:MAG: hydrolase [Anaerovoracaceae bacterium]